MRFFLSLVFLTLICQSVVAADYQYMSPEAVKQQLEAKAELTLVDIQVADEFNTSHIQGAVATYAYPVKSDVERNKLAGAIKTVKQGDDVVVVICPRGKGGAKRTIDEFVRQGVDAKRMFILEHGQAGWPYKELLAKN